MPDASPSDIARHAIRVLAQRRLPPTPDRYAEVWREVGGSDADCAALGALRFADALAALPWPARNLGSALAARRWDEALRQIRALSGPMATPETDAGLATAIRAMLQAWDVHHPGLTRARKRAAVERLLAAAERHPELLAERLMRLVRGWGAGEAPAEDDAEAEDGAAIAQAARLIADLLRFAFADRASIEPDSAAAAATLAAQAGQARTRPDLDALDKALATFRLRFEMAERRDASLAARVHAVLQVLVQNLPLLVDDEATVSGQLEHLNTLLSAPLSPAAMRQTESALRALVYRQSLAKHGLAQAKASLKSMLQTFVARLGEMADATGSYHERLSRHAGRIAQARDIAELSQVVEALGEDSRAMQAGLVRTREELVAARDRAAADAVRMQQLEAELAAASAAARQDALTQALNRRGLDEALAVECARADRSAAPFAVAMLDVDHFKALNDRLGHAAGDAALAHLAEVVRATLRPTDVVARWGGEEFVVLLPGTGLDDAAATMTRVQRALTRRIFLHEHERVLVTFSAGVTLRRTGEPAHAALDRADAALLRAKREGRNRVVAV